jgi:hypothetical protein
MLGSSWVAAQLAASPWSCLFGAHSFQNLWRPRGLFCMSLARHLCKNTTILGGFDVSYNVLANVPCLDWRWNPCSSHTEFPIWDRRLVVASSWGDLSTATVCWDVNTITLHYTQLPAVCPMSLCLDVTLPFISKAERYTVYDHKSTWLHLIMAGRKSW